MKIMRLRNTGRKDMGLFCENYSKEEWGKALSIKEEEKSQYT
jgi:hypothetical protein